MDPIPSFSKVYSLVTQGETQRKLLMHLLLKWILLFQILNCPMIIIVQILVARARTGQFALTMARLVTQWINAISCMVFHQGLSSRISLLWLIKSLQNSCPLLLQCITRILPLHLNSVNSFLSYHLKSKKLPWPMQLLLPVLPVCQCQVLIFPTCFLCTSDQQKGL